MTQPIDNLRERVEEILFDPDEKCYQPNDEVHARGDCSECNRISSLVNFITQACNNARLEGFKECYRLGQSSQGPDWEHFGQLYQSRLKQLEKGG